MLKHLKKLNNLIDSKMQDYLNIIAVFGIFGILNYPIFYILWSLLYSSELHNLPMRIFAAILCFGLVFHKQWPLSFRKFLPLYWYGTILYCLPFFCSYLFFLNHGSSTWLVNSVLATILLIMIVDWLSFAVILILGILLGIICFKINHGNVQINSQDIISTVVNIAWVVLVCIFFSYKKNLHELIKKEYIKSIDQLNHLLEQKVQQRTLELEDALANLEQKVWLRTQELEKALSAKTEILNNLSHEVRTPIQGFTAISTGLAEHWDDFDNNKRQELIKHIALNAKRLSSLVINLLDLSKFSAGKMLLEFKQFDLAKLVAEIIDECQALYLNDKKLDIHFDQPKSALIIADSERIGQVLRNLMINAIKCSNNNSNITLALKNSEITYDDEIVQEAIYFTISDQGIGINQEELLEIFSPFFIGTRTKTNAGGTGLGLAISQEIIQGHHGKIWVENNPEKGAKFSFIIPIVQSKKLDGREIIAENNVSIADNLLAKKPATILIIDDEDACLNSIELLLHSSNYQVIKAKTKIEAWRQLRSNPGKIDLIMLDLMMQDTYGLNILKELKSDPILNKIPVILQSGTSDSKEIETAYEMGIASFIKKPYSKKAIFAELAKILAN